MFNFEGKPGAVGRVPWFVAHRFPIARGALRRRAAAAGARRRTASASSAGPDEAGEVIGKIINDPRSPATASRATPRRRRTRTRSCATCSRRGDAWFRTGDLMRKDERRLFLFRRPHRRHVPLEGRERLDHRRSPRRSTPSPASRTPTSTACGSPGRDGRAGMAAIVCEDACDLAGAVRAPVRAPAGIRAAGVPAHPARDRRHRHLQAEEGRSGGAGLRSRAIVDPIYFNDPETPRLRAARPGAVPAHPGRRRAGVVSRTAVTVMLSVPSHRHAEVPGSRA